MAERQGFEPWDGCPSPVFKTGAFDHSATSPKKLVCVHLYTHITPVNLGAGKTTIPLVASLLAQGPENLEIRVSRPH